MKKPLLSWDAPDATMHPGVVWAEKLDERYLAEVHRTDARHGTLYVFDHAKNDEEIFSKEVGLSYGAILGPDVSDVDLWQTLVTDFIDNSYNK